MLRPLWATIICGDGWSQGHCGTMGHCCSAIGALATVPWARVFGTRYEEASMLPVVDWLDCIGGARADWTRNREHFDTIFSALETLAQVSRRVCEHIRVHALRCRACMLVCMAHVRVHTYPCMCTCMCRYTLTCRCQHFRAGSHHWTMHSMQHRSAECLGP